MRSLVPVALACAGLLAGCGLADQSATPAQVSAPFQERAVHIRQRWI